MILGNGSGGKHGGGGSIAEVCPHGASKCLSTRTSRAVATIVQCIGNKEENVSELLSACHTLRSLQLLVSNAGRPLLDSDPGDDGLLFLIAPLHAGTSCAPGCPIDPQLVARSKIWCKARSSEKRVKNWGPAGANLSGG